MMAGSVTRRNVVQAPAPSVQAASSSAESSARRTGLHAADHKWKGHEQERQYNSRLLVDHRHSVLAEHSSDNACRAVERHQHHARDDGRDREREVDQGVHHVFCGKRVPHEHHAVAVPVTTLITTSPLR